MGKDNIVDGKRKFQQGKLKDQPGLDGKFVKVASRKNTKVVPMPKKGKGNGRTPGR